MRECCGSEEYEGKSSCDRGGWERLDVSRNEGAVILVGLTEDVTSLGLEVK